MRVALAQVLPNGAIRTEPICLDMAVICALGQDHWRHTAVRRGSAADIYSTAKAPRNDFSNKCWAAEVPLLPIVHEIHGGMAKGADAAMRPSVKLWGEGRTRDAVTVRLELVGRLAAVITRTSTRAVQKRQMKKRTFATPDLSATMVRQMFLAVEPEQDDEELGEDRL